MVSKGACRSDGHATKGKRTLEAERAESDTRGREARDGETRLGDDHDSPQDGENPEHLVRESE